MIVLNVHSRRSRFNTQIGDDTTQMSRLIERHTRDGIVREIWTLAGCTENQQIERPVMSVDRV